MGLSWDGGKGINIESVFEDQLQTPFKMYNQRRKCKPIVSKPLQCTFKMKKKLKNLQDGDHEVFLRLKKILSRKLWRMQSTSVSSLFHNFPFIPQK